MINIKEIFEGNPRSILFNCPSCEEKYKTEVEHRLVVDFSYSHRKYKRVDDFINIHEHCEESHEREETKDYHPIVKKALEVFPGSTVQIYPIMEGRSR